MAIDAIRWDWQDGWGPRHDPGFNAACVDRWVDGDSTLAGSKLLLDARWDPSCRWVVHAPPTVSCGWTTILRDDPQTHLLIWMARLGDRRTQRWTVFPPELDSSDPTDTVASRSTRASLLDELLIPYAGEWSHGDLMRRVAMVQALGPDAVCVGTPDPLQPGWSRLNDPNREGPLGMLVQHWRAWPLAHALLDLGASLAVQHANGRSDADLWLDQVGRMPGNEEVRAHWPALLVKALRTVPPGPAWAAWKQTVPRGIVQRCLLDAAQQVEAQALRESCPDPITPRSSRARL